jgi:hypothetical protein
MCEKIYITMWTYLLQQKLNNITLRNVRNIMYNLNNLSAKVTEYIYMKNIKALQKLFVIIFSSIMHSSIYPSKKTT